MPSDREVTRQMLADITWIGNQLKTMGSGFNKHLTAEFVGRTKEFVMGVLYERERQEREEISQNIPTPKDL